MMEVNDEGTEEFNSIVRFIRYLPLGEERRLTIEELFYGYVNMAEDVVEVVLPKIISHAKQFVEEHVVDYIVPKLSASGRTALQVSYHVQSYYNTLPALINDKNIRCASLDVAMENLFLSTQDFPMENQRVSEVNIRLDSRVGSVFKNSASEGFFYFMKSRMEDEEFTSNKWISFMFREMEVHEGTGEIVCIQKEYVEFCMRQLGVKKLKIKTKESIGNYVIKKKRLKTFRELYKDNS